MGQGRRDALSKLTWEGGWVSLPPLPSEKGSLWSPSLAVWRVSSLRGLGGPGITLTGVVPAKVRLKPAGLSGLGLHIQLLSWD